MLDPNDVLRHWNNASAAFPCADAGLVNQTFWVDDPPRAVLQWVNPIFGPEIHLDIDRITRHIEACGLQTTRLLKTRTNGLWVEDESGVWRMLSFIEGTTHHTLNSMDHAFSAGQLVGNFHTAVTTLEHEFHFLRPGAHDTLAHMSTLRTALQTHQAHPLTTPATQLGQEILQDWDSWEGSLSLPNRVCHGDLKISNLRFNSAGDTAIALIDLDTLGPLPLPIELGDAWRSWCNPAGESDPSQVEFSIDIFRASAEGFLSTAPSLADVERDNLVSSIERICLELAARFCADALNNSYFRENRELHPVAGQHNLVRAEAQWRLARSVREQRSDIEAVLQR